jgi:cytochrome c peroxidase
VFIPRNAPSLFNVAALKHLFLDGRVQVDAGGQLRTPAGAQLTADMARVFEFGPISALGMFPVTNRAEMRGQVASGNELAAIRDDDLPSIWRALMARLGQIPEYRDLFEAAYPGQRFDAMTFAHASNAIAGFVVDRLSFTETPWDRFIRGDDRAMTSSQLAGAQTFLSLKCSICHNGATLSDDKFHDVAVAQLGPGEGDGALGSDDFGRMRDRRSGGSLPVPHHAASQRRAHGSVRPRWRHRIASRVRRTLQRERHEADDVRREHAPVRATRHGAA